VESARWTCKYLVEARELLGKVVDAMKKRYYAVAIGILCALALGLARHFSLERERVAAADEKRQWEKIREEHRLWLEMVDVVAQDVHNGSITHDEAVTLLEASFQQRPGLLSSFRASYTNMESLPVSATDREVIAHFLQSRVNLIARSAKECRAELPGKK
jgi:hypothetical protein